MLPSQPHILSIDDDRETAGLIAEELVERGFRVSLAFDGEEGYRSIIANEPDLVLADVNLPSLSGFDLLERLIGFAPRFNNITFVYLTAMSDRANELRGRQMGADDYITKPIDTPPISRANRRRMRAA